MKIKQFLKSALENDDTCSGRYFAFFIQSMIVLSLITFSIETLPNLSLKFKYVLRITEIILVGLFSLN